MLSIFILKEKDMLSKEYVAGLFDGEGTIGVYGVKGWKEMKNFAARMALTGTYRPVIEELQETFGFGSVTLQKRQALQRTPGKTYDPRLCKQCWRWGVTNKRDISTFIEAVLPFSREKKVQLEIVVQFINKDLTGQEAYSLCKEAKNFVYDGEEIFTEANFKGSANPSAKLDEGKVQAIKRRLSKGESQQKIAKDVGVKRQAIWRIAHGKSWAHVR
jgi:DNA-binding XRE family transcriptional regulator